jgi:two-component system, NarL family, nitrate/nitrite response regulator NarL
VRPLSVFACESRPIVVEGLEKVLRTCEDLVFAGSRSSLEESLPAIEGLLPDVVLLDQSAGLKAVLQFIGDIKPVSPESQAVVWVNELAEIECFRALQIGARGILKKTMPVVTLLECIRAVGNGNIWIENSISNQVVGFLNRKNTPRLTPREREIVKHICRGMKNKEIAETLAITPGTVKVHLMHIFEKAGVKDRFELAVHGRKLLGVDLEEGELHGAATRSRA